MSSLRPVLGWLADHWDLIAEGALIAYAVLSVVVAMTDTPDDDEALARLRRALTRASFLAPRDVDRTFSLPGRIERHVDERAEPDD